MTIPFTRSDFHKLCYLPYNTILVSFLAHGADIQGMRDEQAAEVEHRARKLRQHPEMDQDGWGGFNAWVSRIERSFINQLEEGMACGQLAPAKGMDDFEAAAWYICRLETTMMGTWPPFPVQPRWTEHRQQGMVLDVIPVDPRLDPGIDWSTVEPGEKHKTGRIIQ